MDASNLLPGLPGLLTRADSHPIHKINKIALSGQRPLVRLLDQ
jgi:hypothetical protein